MRVSGGHAGNRAGRDRSASHMRDPAPINAPRRTLVPGDMQGRHAGQESGGGDLAWLGEGVPGEAAYTWREVVSLPKPYYQDDAVTIYHGDCREILPLLPKVDLVLTDPP